MQRECFTQSEWQAARDELEQKKEPEMHADLKWLAEHEPQWAMDDDNYKITKYNGKASYVHYVNLDHKELRAGRQSFSRSQWQAARDELLATQVGVVENFMGSPFSTPDEDEEWEKIEGRMDAIGQNGPTGEHYDAVNHPKHYTDHASGVECIQVTEQMGFCLGNAIKYIWRADLKHDAVEDLQKAVWYIEREIQRRRA